VCGESGEGNGGGRGWLRRATRQREKERKRGWRGVSSRTMGHEWLWAARPEAAARARGGGGLANRGGRRGASVSGRVWEGEG
jgi:hypothetical protein